MGQWPMRVLLVSDLHYDLRKLDWVLAESAGVDLLVLAGDLLDIASAVPLDAQIAVVLEYLRASPSARPRWCARATTTSTTATRPARRRPRGSPRRGPDGVAVDGDSVTVGRLDGDGLRVVGGAGDAGGAGSRSSTRPAGRARTVDVGLARARRRVRCPGRAHATTATRSCRGSSTLHRPDVVLCGHIHQAPFVPRGAWVERRGDDVAVQRWPPARPDPDERLHRPHERSRASWWSFDGTGEVSLGETGAAVPDDQ